MRVLAIDFGTSNTVAALLIEGQAPRAVTFDASPLLPSAVYLGPDGQLTVGRDAQRLARLDPTRFEPNPSGGSTTARCCSATGPFRWSS